MNTARLLAALLAASVALACRQDPPPLTLAVRSAVQVDVGIDPSRPPAVWNDVKAFYTQRGNVSAWVQDDGAVRQREAVLAVLDSARTHGLDPADYDRAAIAQRVATVTAVTGDAAERASAYAALDVQITTALLKLGRDVALGRVSPSTVSPQWKARRPAPDFVTALAASESDLGSWLDRVRPRHDDYVRLERALGALVDRAAGSESASSIDDRIRQLAINLERWRWMPDDLGERYLLVNIPAYQVVAREHEHDVLDIRVIVGKRGRETPIFSSTMTTVVFSPYWNIPDTIAVGETVPALARDPQYLRKNDIEILRVTPSGTTTVDPKDVNWNDPSELRTIRFRQRPGPKNALGHVKFLFPNEYNVYLHDTPADELFARPGRAFSHGCVRVEEPEALAQYVLRGDESWDEPKILAAMHAGVERAVTLKTPIPVHLVYFTAMVDEHGELHLFDDVYGYDAKLGASLFR